MISILPASPAERICHRTLLSLWVTPRQRWHTPGQGAGRCGQSAANRRWDELRERAGLGALRLHDLRHGCATFMLAARVPSRAIMEMLGHSGISVTMNTYAHVLPEFRQEAADAIDELFGA